MLASLVSSTALTKDCDDSEKVVSISSSNCCKSESKEDYYHTMEIDQNYEWICQEINSADAHDWSEKMKSKDHASMNHKQKKKKGTNYSKDERGNEEIWECTEESGQKTELHAPTQYQLPSTTFTLDSSSAFKWTSTSSLEQSTSRSSLIENDSLISGHDPKFQMAQLVILGIIAIL